MVFHIARLKARATMVDSGLPNKHVILRGHIYLLSSPSSGLCTVRRPYDVFLHAHIKCDPTQWQLAVGQRRERRPGLYSRAIAVTLSSQAQWMQHNEKSLRRVRVSRYRRAPSDSFKITNIKRKHETDFRKMFLLQSMPYN